MLDEHARPVAPGVELTSFDWIAAEGFIRGQALEVDLGDGGTHFEYLDPGRIAGADSVEAMVEERGAIAGSNGDFFDINNSNAPLGAAVSKGAVRKGTADRHDVIGFDSAGLGALSRAFLTGEISTPTGTRPLAGYNQPTISGDGIAAFTSLWGDYTRTRVLEGRPGHEVLITDGVVTASTPDVGEGRLPSATIALVGKGTGAEQLATLEVGDRVEVSHGLRFDGPELVEAIGGNPVLVRDGKPVPSSDPAAHPRTALGFNKDGSKAYLVVIDGRISESRGMTLTELGEYMAELGAYTALNLDGGGSSTLVAREAGETEVEVENTPSDGSQRPVPNGLALFADEGSGRLTGMRLVPTENDRDDWLTVFPGLHRDLTALGHDETLSPVPTDPTWRTGSGRVAKINDSGVLTGVRQGSTAVTARSGRISGSVDVRVLDRLDRIRPTVDKLSLTDGDQTGSFGLTGFDRGGFTAPVSPRDVRLDYDESMIKVDATPEGTFTVTPKVDRAGFVITATVAGAVTHLPVSVGTDTAVVASFEQDADQWVWGGARSTGSLEPAPGHESDTAVKLAYDFTGSTATRTAYAEAPEPLAFDGQPLAIGAWIHGNGGGEWTAFNIIDAEGTLRAIYGPYVDWTGWQYMEVPVPQTLAMPIRLSRVTMIETGADRQYTGEVLIDDVTVKTAPEVTVPETEPVEDPVVITDGTLEDDRRTWQYAVVSDAQFTADDQSLVQQARRTLREAKAADPDFVVINGDWVDTGYPEDLDRAHQVITEELGDLPWYYLPGNHEIYGPGTIDNFVEKFGAAQHSFTHRGTRFVLLNSATGTLQGGGFGQWQLLHDALQEAKDDPGIDGVVAMWHHPPRDPSPLKNSQLADPTEAATVEKLLADFRMETGKGAAFIGSHVGAFSAAGVDGVPYVINGNAGKAPSTGQAGGFTGWSLVGIDRDAARQPADQRHRPAEDPWLQVEVRPHVDELTLTAPDSLRVGDTGVATATVGQGDRSFDLGYPASGDWSGSKVAIDGPRGGAVIDFDPQTGTITALRPGTATLAVTVNGVRKEASIRVR